ncbi:MAG: hypothetical protein WCF96_01485 [Eubacteriales bacterium]
MKVFLIFTSILTINIGALIFQSDFNRFTIFSEVVKNFADEAASSTALYYDEDNYSNGYLVSNKEEAMEHLEFLIDSLMKKYNDQGIMDIEYNIYFADQSNMIYAFKNSKMIYEKEIIFPFYFDDESQNSILVSRPSIILNLSLKFNDIFRLPFIKQEVVSRSSMYELKSRGGDF